MKKADRIQLETCLYDLERFLQWVRCDYIAIRNTRFQCDLNKDCGSPLQYVENALDKLKQIHANQF